MTATDWVWESAWLRHAQALWEWQAHPDRESALAHARERIAAGCRCVEIHEASESTRQVRNREYL